MAEQFFAMVIEVDGERFEAAEIDFMVGLNADNVTVRSAEVTFVLQNGDTYTLDCEPLGVTPPVLSQRLLEQKVAATPMTVWGGDVARRHLRFVFSREPVERLALLGERLQAALE